VHFKAGIFLRIELSFGSTNGGGNTQNINMKAMNKHMYQQAFQFSYDPIFKRFNRELRDIENRNFMIDKFYLDLKSKKELSLNEQAVVQDPNLARYAAMSYINFLNRRQRMIERGDTHDNFEEDEEENSQSEDESQDSASRSAIDETRRDKKGGNQRESLAQKGLGTI
jgi:hypothetical protein